ncbi:F-box domain protein [Trichuris suis]|nr:F-box domain protein [Trichuris suis]
MAGKASEKQCITDNAQWIQAFYEDELETHILHCAYCFCAKEVCPANLICPIVCCPNQCSATMHQCKLKEHLAELCPLERVACINATYGCPVKLLRRDRGKHLSNCPASVLQCNMERMRQLLPLAQRLYLRGTTPSGCGSDHLDLCLALSDQRKWAQERCQLEAKNGLLSDNDLEERNDSADNVLSPVSQECVLCKQDPGSQHLHIVGAMGACGNPVSSEPTKKAATTPEPFYIKHGLQLSLTTEFQAMHRPKASNSVTVRCGQLLRRDQYSDHAKSVHADVVNSMEWMLARCPMYLHGCDMMVTRVLPAKGRLLYSEWSDSLVLRHDCEPRPAAAMGSKAPTLTDLPVEVLQTILTQLDSTSMLALSLVNKRLRETTQHYLLDKGMVEYRWVRRSDQANGWKEDGLRWTFAKSFEPVRRWIVRPAKELCDHLRICPYLNPVVHEERVPVLTFVLPSSR